jgi:hypothetical protein
MPCAIEHMLDCKFTKYTYFSTIPIIKDLFSEENFPFDNKKKGCILYKKFVLEKGPFLEGKKRVEFAIFRP